MRLRKKATAIMALTALFFFLHDSVILAISLGPLNLKSGQGENFKAIVPVDLDATENAENLTVGLGNKQDYTRIGENMPDAVNKIRVAILREGGIKALLYSDDALEGTSFNLVLKAIIDGGTMLKKYSVKLGKEVSGTAGPPRIGEVTRAKVYGPVRAGETLSDIASRLGYRGADLEKAIVSIWVANEPAFVSGNLHGLKAGALLNISGVQEYVKQVSQREASYVIEAQWEKWRKIVQARTSTTKISVAESPVGQAVSQPQPARPAPALVSLKEESSKAYTFPIIQNVEQMMAVPQTAQPVEALPLSNTPLTATAEKQPSPEPAYMSDVSQLRSEIKRVATRLNGKTLLLQERLKEQTATAESSNRKFFLILYALLVENAILIAVILRSRARKESRKHYAELDGAQAAFSEGTN